MSRKIDLVHVFNEAGDSVVTIEFLSKKIKALEEQNEALKRLNATLLRRLNLAGEDPAASLNS